MIIFHHAHGVENGSKRGRREASARTARYREIVDGGKQDVLFLGHVCRKFVCELIERVPHLSQLWMPPAMTRDQFGEPGLDRWRHLADVSMMALDDVFRERVELFPPIVGATA